MYQVKYYRSLILDHPVALFLEDTIDTEVCTPKGPLLAEEDICTKFLALPEFLRRLSSKLPVDQVGLTANIVEPIRRVCKQFQKLSLNLAKLRFSLWSSEVGPHT